MSTTENKSYNNELYESLSEIDADIINKINAITSSYKLNETDEKELKGIKKEMNEEKKKFNNIVKMTIDKKRERYSDISFTSNNFCICYDKKNLIFDIESGERMEHVSDNDIVIEVANKKSAIEYIIGYSFEYGGVITNIVSYNIVNDYKINFILREERFYPLISYPYHFIKNCNLSLKNPNSYYGPENDIFRIVKANEFIKGMFGIDRNYSLTLYNFFNCYHNNIATEAIIKTISKEDILSKLLFIEQKETTNIYKLIGCTKQDYNYAKKLDVLKRYIDFKIDSDLKYYAHHCNAFNNFSEKKWIDIIKESEEWEKELEDNNIAFSTYYCRGDNKLLKNIIEYYATSELPAYYPKFLKFCHYVITGTINQGFSSVRKFSEELNDYHEIIERMHDTPVLYSGMIEPLHNLASRNYQIHITEIQKKDFEKVYKKYKNDIIKEYAIIYPKTPHDVVKEGNSLHHCVKSYIGRICMGKSIIGFLRKKDTPDTSLITFEIVKDTIVQVRGSYNRNPSVTERKILKEYAEKINLDINF